MTYAKYLATICGLVLYELKKLLQNRFLFLTAGILLLAELALSVDEWSTIGSYRKIAGMINKHYDWLSSADESELDSFRKEMIQKYGEDILDPNAPIVTDTRLYDLPGYLGEGIQDISILMAYREHVRKNQEISDDTAYTVRMAKLLSQEASKKSDDYAVRRNRQIIRRYSVERPVASGYIIGLDKFLCESERTMIPILLLVFLLSANQFSKEWTGRNHLLILSSEKGTVPEAIAKFFVGIIYAILITIVFQTVSILFRACDTGLYGWTDPVQVVEALRLCPFILPVWAGVIWMIVFRCIAACTIAVLCTIISILIREEVFSYACASALILLSILSLFVSSGFLSKDGFLLSPASLALPDRFVRSWYTANVFSFPVLWLLICLFGQLVLQSVLIFAGIRLHSRIRNRI